MSITVVKAGLFDSIQDGGRQGYQHLGINPGGSMDRYAAAIANILAGNDEKTPLLELHFPASSFLFTSPAMISLSGADFLASVNGCPIPLQQPVLVNTNSLLEFSQRKSGSRVYLAVHGGFSNLSQWLGSYSTHSQLKVAGFRGRALKKGDILDTKSPPAWAPTGNDLSFLVMNWKTLPLTYVTKKKIRVLPGPEWDYLDKTAQETFKTQGFIIGQQSDRMGYRLKGTPLEKIIHSELVSSPVTFGTIQLLPGGQLIVLMADHQTTGGYPRVATVISADHRILAQKSAGDEIQFCLADQQTAEDLFIKQQLYVHHLHRSCSLKLAQLIHQ